MVYTTPTYKIGDIVITKPKGDITVYHMGKLIDAESNSDGSIWTYIIDCANDGLKTNIIDADIQEKVI